MRGLREKSDQTTVCATQPILLGCWKPKKKASRQNRDHFFGGPAHVVSLAAFASCLNLGALSGLQFQIWSIVVGLQPCPLV